MTRDCKPAGTGSWRIPVLTATLCFHISSICWNSRLGQRGICSLPKKRNNWKYSYNFYQSLRPLSLKTFVRQPKVTSLKKKTDIRPAVVLEIHIYKDQKLPTIALTQYITSTLVLQACTRPSKQLTCITQVSGGHVLLHHIRACMLSPPHWTTLLDTYSTHCPQTLQIYPFLTESSWPKLLLPVQEELVNAESMVWGQCALQRISQFKGPSTCI